MSSGDEQGLIDVLLGRAHRGLVQAGDCGLDRGIRSVDAGDYDRRRRRSPRIRRAFDGAAQRHDQRERDRRLRISLVAGQTYLFSVRGTGASPLGDTYLYVLDTGFNSSLEDDDGGDGVNSLITYTATFTGTHVLGVSAYPGSGCTDLYARRVRQAGDDVVSDDFAVCQRRSPSTPRSSASSIRARGRTARTSARSIPTRSRSRRANTTRFEMGRRLRLQLGSRSTSAGETRPRTVLYGPG
jgi:hypothetical protein